MSEIPREKTNASPHPANKIGEASTTRDQDHKLDEFVGTLLDAMVQHMGVHSISYFERDDKSGRLLPKVHRSQRGDESATIESVFEPLVREDPIAMEIAARWWQELAGREIYVQSLEDLETRASLLPFSVSWHDGDKIKWTACCPLYVGQRAVGFVGVRTRNQDGFTDDQCQLIRTLTHQVGLAVNFERLNEQAKRTAIADARANELAEVNKVLSRTQAKLASTSDLKDFLDRVLLEISRSTGARTMSVFVVDAVRNELAASRITCDGRVVNIDTDERFRFWRKPIPVDKQGVFARMLETGGLTYQVGEKNSDMWSESVPWHKQMGHQSLICIPMQSSRGPLGFIGAGFTHEVDLAEPKLNLIRALANQASLAIELTRLTEESSQLALAQQRKVAAQEKADELQRVNDMLQESIAGLSVAETVDRFPDLVLLQIANEFAAASVAAFTLDAKQNQASMRHAVQFGEIVEIKTDWRYQLWRAPISLQDTRANELLESIITEEWILCDPTSDPRYLPESHQWHRDLGHRSSLLVGLTMGERLVGFLGVAFSKSDPQLSPDQVRLGRTLAHQALLAMELSQMSSAAQTNAIVEERNRMARGIHDTIVSRLTGVLLNLEAAEQSGTRDGEKFIRQAKDLARGILIESRRSVLALRPSDQGIPLVEELRQIPLQIGRNQIDCRVVANDEGRGLPPLVQLELLRVAQEAVTHAIRHSDASITEIRFEADAESWVLEVSHDGSGLDVDATTKERDGFQIQQMRERIEAAGGELAITSSAAEGTLVSATIRRE